MVKLVLQLGCVGRSVNPDYPDFDDILEGPSLPMNPSNHQALDYVRLLWPTALCELIAVETNRYAFQRHVRDWTPTSVDEICAFLGTIVLIGYHTLPSFEKYWSNKKFNGVPALQERMTFGRFRGLWGNLHIVDNETDDSSDKFFKVRPVISQLSSRCTMNWGYVHLVTLLFPSFPVCYMYVAFVPVYNVRLPVPVHRQLVSHCVHLFIHDHTQEPSIGFIHH